MDWISLINREKTVEWRRHLHMYPEAAYNEVKTSEYIADKLKGYAGITIERPTKTSVVATLSGAKPGRTVGLRADIDALPVQEETDLPYKSRIDGFMHACGHDCHAAALLGAADALHGMRGELCGTVKFIFQHAEELLPGGAREIVDTGVLNGVQVFYGSHVFTDTPVGIVKSAEGGLTANSDRFAIKVFGKGAHGAKPEDSVDSLLVGAEIAQSLNTIVSRNISAFKSAVLSVCRFVSGTAFNVIPASAEIDGTVRTYDPDVRDRIESRLRDLVKGICEAYGAAYEIVYERGYGAVFNDGKYVELVKDIARAMPGVKYTEMRKMMGGEDFSEYQSVAPSVFVGIGAGQPSGEYYANHHPKFCVDENVLPIAAAMYAAFAFEAAKH